MVSKLALGSAGMALKKNSPYSKFLALEKLKVIESGQIEKLMANYNSNNYCGMANDDNGKSLSYQKLILLFIIIGVGMGLATSILIWEIFKKNLCTMRLKLDETQIIDLRKQLRN